MMSVRAAIAPFPWFLCLLSLAIVITTAVYSKYSREQYDSAENIFDTLSVDNTDTADDVLHALVWGILPAWIFTVVVIAVAFVSIVIKYLAAQKREAYQQGSDIAVRAKWCASFTFNVAHVFMVFGLVMAYVACVFMVLLIILQVLIAVGLRATKSATAAASNLALKATQTAANATHKVTGDIDQFLDSAKNSLAGVISDLQICNLQVCEKSNAKLSSLVSDIDIWNATSNACPSTCLDAGRLWFIQDKVHTDFIEGHRGNNSCICDSIYLNKLEDESKDGFDASVRAAITIGLMYLLWLLVFGSIAMTLMSIWKDRQWMKRLHAKAGEASGGLVPASKHVPSETALEFPSLQTRDEPATV